MVQIDNNMISREFDLKMNISEGKTRPWHKFPRDF